MNDSLLNWLFRGIKTNANERAGELNIKANPWEWQSESCSSEKRLKMHTTKIDDWLEMK